MNLNRRVPNGLPGGVRGRKFYYFLLLDWQYLAKEDKAMKDTFVLKTTIKEFSTIKECFEQEQIEEEDLIITNEFIYNTKFKDVDANVIFQEKYGVGEPTDEMIENIRKDVPQNVKRIIAIGGGTIIDISKFLILDYQGTIDQVILHEIPYKKAKELYVVPTTCGTGSEVTNVAISELKKRKIKKGLADDLIYPDKALLIPEMVETLPYKFFATSSIDALIHSVESYLSPNSTLYSRMFSVKAMTMILNGFKKVVRDGKENWSQYAKEFLIASNLAGIAFGNAGCAAVHALSYPLGGAYHIPHGEANQLMFESVYNKYYEKDPNGHIQDFFEVVSEILGVEKEDALKALFALTNQILKRKPLSSYGIKKEELPEFVKSVIEGQQRLLNNNYVELSSDDMIEIYNNVYDK